MQDLPDLSGRAALVTGAGSDAGRAVALVLGQAGAAVCVSDINPNHAGATAAAIEAAGGRAFDWVADISNKFQVGAMIEELRDRFGGLHIVVSGWHVNKRSAFLNLDEYDWRRVLEINLTGAFFISQLAARVMADEGGGAIFHLVGLLDDSAAVQQAPYYASQMALMGLAKTMALELEAQRVLVRAILLDSDAASAAAQVLGHLRAF